MFKFWNWSREGWTLAIAVVALMQPWLTAAWKRLFKAGTIDIYETGSLEIGFSGAGATIAVIGTLRSRDRDMFIERAYLTLLMPTDSEPRRLDWAVFRTTKTVIGQTAAVFGQLGQTGEVSVDLPASFMISAVQPYRFNILFSDILLADQLRSILMKYSQSWLSYLDRQGVTARMNALGTDQQKLLTALMKAFDAFMTTTEYVAALTEVEKLFYWTPGTYRLTFNVETARPNRRYRETWSFNLLEDAIESLRLNPPAILSEAAGLPLMSGHYQFAYPRYEEALARTPKVG